MNDSKYLKNAEIQSDSWDQSHKNSDTCVIKDHLNYRENENRRIHELEPLYFLKVGHIRKMYSRFTLHFIP